MTNSHLKPIWKSLKNVLLRPWRTEVLVLVPHTDHIPVPVVQWCSGVAFFFFFNSTIKVLDKWALYRIQHWFTDAYALVLIKLGYKCVLPTQNHTCTHTHMSNESCLERKTERKWPLSWQHLLDFEGNLLKVLQRIKNEFKDTQMINIQLN